MSWKPIPPEVTIKVGVGLNDLLFGASREEVREHLGPPDEAQEEFADPNNQYESWDYDWGLSTYFNRGDGFRLGTLQIEDSRATLLGFRPIGLELIEIQSVISKLAPGFGECEEEDMALEEFPTMFLLSYPLKNLNLWLADGRVEAVQWGYLFSADGETVLWPQLERRDRG